MINHIGFIMDGNRRYAEKQKLGKREGYSKGMMKFLEFVSYQVKYNLKETSFFALSNDNYTNRPEDEKEILAELTDFFYKDKQIREFFVKNNIKILIKGNIEEIERKDKQVLNKKKFAIKSMKQELEKWNEQSKPHRFNVNIAINYDGQSEILHAFKEIYSKLKNEELKINSVNEKTIKKHLWFNGVEPEIIVRTGDAPRLSGFMLWDSKYSEIYFTRKLWPELDESDFIAILDWYKGIKRNFGK